MRDYGLTVKLTTGADEQLADLFWNKLQNSSLQIAIEARDAIEAGFSQIERNPYSCPMASDNPMERKLVIPFGRRTGYVALFSIESDTTVLVTAIRHQLQDDFLR